jgi:hypothetical protein
MAHMRPKKPCPGCNGDDASKPNHCVTCAIKHCEQPREGGTGLCFECAKFPCVRLRRLDKRYREKYGMSMTDDLERIRDRGLEAFVEEEPQRWRCPGCGETLCVHLDQCIRCGRDRR